MKIRNTFIIFVISALSCFAGTNIVTPILNGQLQTYLDANNQGISNLNAVQFHDGTVQSTAGGNQTNVLYPVSTNGITYSLGPNLAAGHSYTNYSDPNNGSVGSYVLSVTPGATYQYVGQASPGNTGLVLLNNGFGFSADADDDNFVTAPITILFTAYNNWVNFQDLSDGTGLVGDTLKLVTFVTNTANQTLAGGNPADLRSILDFGAVGDGTTDSTAAINAALAAGNIFCPQPAVGYLVSSELLIPSNRKIVATQATFIRAANSVTNSGGQCEFWRNADYLNGNTNISIDGGLYNGNYANNPGANFNTGDGAGFRFNHVSGLTVKNVTLTNICFFRMPTGNVSNFVFQNITTYNDGVNLHEDTLHIFGPCGYGTIRDILAVGGNDDLIALNADDDGVIMSSGTIHDILVDGVNCNGYGGPIVRLLATTDNITNIIVRNVTGSSGIGNAVNISTIGGIASGVIDNIVFDNLNVATPRFQDAFILYSGNFGGTFTIRNCTWSPGTLGGSPDAGQMFFFMTNGVITNLFLAGNSVVNYRTNLAPITISSSATNYNLFSYDFSVTSNNAPDLGSFYNLGSHTVNHYLPFNVNNNLVAPNGGSVTGPFTNGNLTASTAVYADANKALQSSTTTTTELSYVHGVTSAIQTQLGLLAPIASPTFTGVVTIPTLKLNNGGTPLIFTNGTGNSSGIGTGGAAILEPNSDDNLQIADITVAGSPSASALIALVEYSAPQATSNRTVLMTAMGGSNAALVGPFRDFYVTNFTTSNYQIWSGTTAATAGAFKLGLYNIK